MDFSIHPNNLNSISTRTSAGKDDKERQLNRLRESTREFEAIYVNEMFKAMRKTVPEDGIFKTSKTEEMFRDMMDMELARETAKGDGIGIGKAMYDQMKETIENKR